jgi:thiamine pyrophosphokinase
MTTPNRPDDQRSRHAAIFLNGSYPIGHLEFYRDHVQKALTRGLVVAVDGALHLFQRFGMRPHLILGDFDSVTHETLADFTEIERVSYPTEKDQTDGELALRYILDRGYDSVDIFGAIDTQFETDQMLANIFSLSIANEYSRASGVKIAARLVDHLQHIYLLENDSLGLSGTAGDILSIVPISQQVTLSVGGVKWPLQEVPIEFGSSRPLRNEFAGDTATMRVSGTAAVIHRHTQ